MKGLARCCLVERRTQTSWAALSPVTQNHAPKPAAWPVNSDSKDFLISSSFSLMLILNASVVSCT
jgi:hypothetical protein